MTLTEFLLARIAEDRARAESLHSVSWHPRWTTSPAGEVLASPPPTIDFKARVLAECEAKRQIMSRAMLLLDSWAAVERGHPEEAPYPDVTRRERSFWRSTLRDLAELYADHPDYRDEWKP